MKIEKFNENSNSLEDKKYEDFIEMVINKFYPDDDLRNMGTYNCGKKFLGSRSYIRSNFYFNIIDEDDLKIMQNILTYFKEFDPTSSMFIRVMREDNSHEIVECNIDLKSSVAFSDIYRDLEALSQSKKYNL